jgi:hypothetical protein
LRNGQPRGRQAGWAKLLSTKEPQQETGRGWGHILLPGEDCFVLWQRFSEQLVLSKAFLQ